MRELIVRVAAETRRSLPGREDLWCGKDEHTVFFSQGIEFSCILDNIIRFLTI